MAKGELTPNTYTPSQLASEVQTLAENYRGAVSEIEDTREGIAQVQTTVDEINSKIVTPKYQAKIVDPTTSQQLIQPDAGYDALSSVTVNASSVGRTLETFVMRNNQEDLFDLNLNGNVPDYACYQQSHLRKVTGNITEIGSHAFDYCLSLQEIDCRNVTSLGESAFIGCQQLYVVDLRNLANVSRNAFINCHIRYLDIRKATIIGAAALQANYGLILIDFTSCETPPTIMNTTFALVPTTARYVFKDATVKAAVQSATNWSALASQIYTVAEIEALVGMTYDEYYLQIFGHPRND